MLVRLCLLITLLAGVPLVATDYLTDALRATMFDVPESECRQMFAGVAAELYGFGSRTRKTKNQGFCH